MKKERACMHVLGGWIGGDQVREMKWVNGLVDVVRE